MCRLSRGPTGTVAMQASDAAGDSIEEQSQPMLQGTRAEAGIINTLNDLQPSGVLNRHAMRGRFSMQDLLVHSDSDEQAGNSFDDRGVSHDPVTAGLVNLAIARSLFGR
jgi:phage-related minor tail protein